MLQRRTETGVNEMSELPRRRPRKRLTREESRALTRARLLESAHALFAAKGFEGTSVDDIARDAGYTRGAVYSNFANKEAIMAALIRTGFEGDLAGIREMASASTLPDSAGIYRLLAERFYGNAESTLWMLEFQLAAVRHPELRDGYREQFARLRSSVAKLIAAQYEREGLPKPEQVERFADVFIAVLSGVSLIKILDPEQVDAPLFEETFVALANGIRGVVWGGDAK